MRKLSKTLAVVSVLAPVGANALGVGEIKLHSALNQQLNAEIPLIVSAEESVSDIRVRLASPEAFEKAGIARHFFLSNIKFEPMIKADGSVVIKMTSREAVREPFLNFLLQVDWPQGNVFREFTVLVDPPATYKEAFIPAQTAPVTRRAAASTESFEARRTGSGRTASYDYQASSGIYGPTARNDTLWAIAKRVNRDGSVTHEQMMIALFEQNPEAFYKPNVNALMAGKKLRVPEKEVILQLSAKDATQEFKRQNDVWSGKLDAKPRIEPQPVEATESSESDGQLKLLSPTETASTDGRIAATDSPAQSGTGAQLAMEMAETISQENENLRSRIEELEQQLKALQGMLTVRNAELSQLQTGQPGETTEDVQAPPKVLDVDAGKEQAETAPVQAVAPVAAVVPQQAPKDIAPPPERQPQAATPEEPAEDSAMNLYTMTLGGLGLGLMGLLGWWIYRRKREDDYETESILSALSGYSDQATSTEQLVVPTIEESETTVGASVTEESSFLSEFTPSDFDAFETDQLEVDPISEADVYLAYGRYKQAEDLIRNSLETHPNRDDCKLKLLEIFYANENSEAFEKYAEELLAEKKDEDTEFWEKVVEMGHEVCPESMLFGGGGKQSDEASSDVDEPPVSSAGLEDEISLDEPENVQPNADDVRLDSGKDVSEDDVPEENRSLDFDLDSVGTTTSTMDGGGDDRSDPDALEFRLDTDAESEKTEDDDHDFEFSFDLGDQPEPASGEVDFGEGEFSDLTDMDEVETKLDLAKAYVDMDDTSAARSILDEVIEAGTEDQKKEAQAMMEKLST